MEVRIYTYYDESDLTKRLRELYKLFDIVDIKYSITCNGSLTKYSALVIFKDK